MNKYAVYYKSRVFGNSYLHTFANSGDDAIAYVRANGIGFSNGVVFADEILFAELIPFKGWN
jgi:hypothetical protein